MYRNTERETIILFDEGCEVSKIETCNKGFQHQIQKLQKYFPELVKTIQPLDKWGYMVFEIPKEWIKIKGKNKPQEKGEEDDS